MDLRNFPFDDQKCNLTIESCKFMDSSYLLQNKMEIILGYLISVNFKILSTVLSFYIQL